MEANDANMQGLFRAYNAAFTKAQLEASGRVGERDVTFEELAYAIKSNARLDQHAWMMQLPGMREWIGDRLVNEMEFDAINVVNKDFESTVTVKINDIEDDQYGLYTPMIRAMGAAAAKLWMELCIQALVKNGNWADGKPFFAANRKLSTGQTSVITNGTKAAFSESAVKDAIVKMRTFMLSANRPAQVSPLYILVGPALEDAAAALFEREFTTDGTGTVSNTSKGRLKVRVSDLLAGEHENKWFVLGEKNGLKAVSVQQRKLPALVAKDKPGDNNVFWQNKAVYGTHARGESFLTLPVLAYAGGLADVEDLAPTPPGGGEGGGG